MYMHKHFDYYPKGYYKSTNIFFCSHNQKINNFNNKIRDKQHMLNHEYAYTNKHINRLNDAHDFSNKCNEVRRYRHNIKMPYDVYANDNCMAHIK